MISRRQFLKHSARGLTLVAAGTYVPAFLARTARAATPDKDGNILVVIQLSGGNDGLNTVVPFADDLYYQARPSLGLAADATLKIDAHSGLHPAFAPLKAEFDAGHFSIVQNVGYPNPNRSHFKSMEIWHTGSPGLSQNRGWLGRYFDAQCSGVAPRERNGRIGVSFGKVMPQALRNDANVGLALDDPDTFQWNASGETLALAREQKAIFERINAPGGAASFDTLASLGGVGSEPAALDFLRHTALNAIGAGDDIRAILRKQKNEGPYPDSQLASQLGMISRLISGDFPARVYYASQGGFDTHANQPESHRRLLGDLSSSLSAFLKDLRQHRQHDRVIVMAFSEFGRRVAENGSTGTDHGAAAPVFLFGEKVKGGLHGPPPDLANLIDGDVRHTVDFRQVYTTLLEDWLRTPARGIFPERFEKISLI